MDKSALLHRLCALSEEYNWKQLGVSARSTSPAVNDEEVFCKPCGYSTEGCSCCIQDKTMSTFSSEQLHVLASPSPVMTSTKSRRKVIVDSEDDAEHSSPPRTSTDAAFKKPGSTPVVLVDSDDDDEVVALKVPASARSKSKHIILSDSEDEASLPPACGTNTTKPNEIKKRIFDDDDDSIADGDIIDAESVEESVDQVHSVDSSDGEQSDNDWIANTSDEEEDGVVDSDLSGDDINSHRDTYTDKENVGNVGNSTRNETKPISATPRKAHFVDLSETPDSPPARKTPAKTPTTGWKTAGAANSSKKNIELTTPARKHSRQSLNIMRVEALSTGKKKFKTVCSQLAQDLFHLYNEIIFENQLPADMSVTWSKRLLTTAGVCRQSRKSVLGVVERTASIELSLKVLDDEERLRSTLIHEMCHAATFLIDELDHEQHGKNFKKWGKKATKQFPEIAVTTCHAYQIHMPHKFKCVNTICGVVYSRHTKKGINTDKQRCGVCRGMLEYQGISDKDGNIAKPRQATGYSIYVKDNFARVKAELCSEWGGSATQSTTAVMKELAVQYKAQKNTTTESSTATESQDSGMVDLTEDQDSTDEQGSAVDDLEGLMGTLVL